VTTHAATVYVIDDDPSVRKSLVRLLTQAGYRTEAFASALEFLEGARREGPCCLVLDVRMPGLTGLDFQEALATAGERMAIVFITAHGDVPMTARAMKAGAVDFLAKPYSREDLLAAVEQAVARDTRERGARAQVAEVEARLRTLTAREADVLALVVRGLLNKQIAVELGITEGTVKIHRARVMEKMRVGSVAELVRLTDRVTLPER
jgi:FixJ family two-component response regulator